MFSNFKKKYTFLITYWIPKYYFPKRGLILTFYFLIICFLKFKNPSPFHIQGLWWILFGWTIRISASISISSHSNSSIIEVPQLANKGIYSYIRHPLYLGNIFIGIGTYITSFYYVWHSFIIDIFIIHHIILILSENSFLRKECFTSYLEYTKKTPFWFLPFKNKNFTNQHENKKNNIKKIFKKVIHSQAQHVIKTIISLVIIYFLSSRVSY